MVAYVPRIRVSINLNMNHAYATKGKVLNLPNISVLFNKCVTMLKIAAIV